MNSKMLFYIPEYRPLADIPMIKRRFILAEKIKSEKIGTVVTGRSATDEDVLSFHTPEYVDALRTGYPDEIASSGLHWSETLYEDAKKNTGSLLNAIDESLSKGVSGALGLGGHHALPEHGGALSVLNCIGIGVMYAKKRVQRVLMLDLDMHFSNGTTIGLADAENVFLFDYYGQAYNFNRPNIPHLFRDLSGEPYGASYLNMLRNELPRTIDQFQPNLCIYLSGMDVYRGSANARLLLTEKDIQDREEFVFNQFAERKIPIAYTYGGGYYTEETAANLYYLAAKAASDAFLKFYNS
ncbi:MAG TPA: hypothetical protein PKW17_09875 [Smithellaceae bacterium]|nr:hypothetical protein [Smithellaceae bacterium]HPM09128.1 hypothetical protein [Paludibacter sp.]